MNEKCPKCGSKKHIIIFMGYPEDIRDENEIQCYDCGWKGYTYQLDGYVGSLVTLFRKIPLGKCVICKEDIIDTFSTFCFSMHWKLPLFENSDDYLFCTQKCLSIAMEYKTELDVISKKKFDEKFKMGEVK